jgi:hypothetical protein
VDALIPAPRRLKSGSNSVKRSAFEIETRIPGCRLHEQRSSGSAVPMHRRHRCRFNPPGQGAPEAAPKRLPARDESRPPPHPRVEAAAEGASRQKGDSTEQRWPATRDPNGVRCFRGAVGAVSMEVRIHARYLRHFGVSAGRPIFLSEAACIPRLENSLDRTRNFICFDGFEWPHDP